MNNDTKHEAQDQDTIKQQFNQWWKKNYPHYPQETTHGFSLWEAFQAGAEWQRSQQSAPAGYVMVPVKMTNDQYRAVTEIEGTEYTSVRDIYRIALAAAPKAEPQPVSDDANKVLIDALEKIMNLEGTELNEWDAVDRLIPEICNSAHKALAAYSAAMGSKGDE